MVEVTPEEHKERGNQAFAKNEFEEAIKHYSEAIKLDSTNHVFFSNRSASYSGLKKWNEAIKDAKECIRLNPEFMKGYYRLATAQLEQEEYDLAQATIKQGLTLDANNTQLLKVLRSIKQARKNSKVVNGSNGGLVSTGVTGGNGGNGGLPHHGGKLDSATSRELYDLQVQYGQTTKEFNTVQANLNKIQREYKMQELTHKQLSSESTINQEKASYRAIGKVFYKSTHNQVLDHLKDSMDERSKKEIDLKQKMDYLERRMKSQQTNMEELASSATSAT